MDQYRAGSIITPEHLKNAKVLIVDDMPVTRIIIQGIISDYYQVLLAESGEEALDIISKEQPDLVLMDVILGGISGIDVCKEIKKDVSLSNIPVIFITGLESEDDEGMCWNAGGSDYITKPVNTTTLLNRVKTQLTIKWQSDYLRSLAYKDGLTGLNNRRYFDIHLDNQVKHCQRYHCDLSLLMIDIDFFKQYNDTHGHLSGDRCLKFVASILQEKAQRPLEVVSRYGGEEFAILLPNISTKDAEIVAINIQQALNEEGKHSRYSKLHLDQVTVSIGIASLVANEESDVLLKQADDALYKAKAEGRNCYRISQPFSGSYI